MNRDELVEAVREVQFKRRLIQIQPAILNMLLDVWEPLIRADDRALGEALYKVLLRDQRADLHAKVEALLNDMHADWSNPRYQAVLDLIDGGADEPVR